MSDAPDAVTQVARDLTEIVDLAVNLATQAVHRANDREIPGGAAMVSLAPVANLEAWQHRLDTLEREAVLADEYPDVPDDPDDDWPPLQTLLFWSEQWRVQHNAETDLRPTLASEAGFIRQILNWAYDNEPHWDNFAADIAKTKTRLENILAAGRRSEHGVQCFDCQVDLVRPSRDPQTVHHCEGRDGTCRWPHRYCPHDRGGLADEWHCPRCRRKYDVEAYYRAVQHAHFVHADYLPLTECIERTGAPRGSIQGWATRGQVRKRKDPDTGRMTYCVADIEVRLATDDVAS